MRGQASGQPLPDDSGLRGSGLAKSGDILQSPQIAPEAPGTPVASPEHRPPVDKGVIHQIRKDPTTGGSQTYQEFLDIYGDLVGKEKWEAAERCFPKIDSPRGSMASGRGSSSYRSRGGTRGGGSASYRRQKR